LRSFPREVKQILTRTGGFLAGFTHSLQPYTGCEFSCVYCYVREMAVQKTNPFGLPWSEWIAPKTNAPELLRRVAERGRLGEARIFCSSSTDPYTPQERRFELTRGCLEVMVRHPPAALVLQTRSPLVVRDAALLARLPRTVASVTVTTDDEAVRRLLEPNSPAIERRLDALRRLRAAGVRTQAAVAPLTSSAATAPGAGAAAPPSPCCVSAASAPGPSRATPPRRPRSSAACSARTAWSSPRSASTTSPGSEPDPRRVGRRRKVSGPGPNARRAAAQLTRWAGR
jgi:uncharacterized Fe-S cluster-containing radical SAM superfamily protein